VAASLAVLGIFYLNTGRGVKTFLCVAVEFSPRCMRLCSSAGFDTEKAALCFDSFQTVMERERKERGQEGEENGVGGSG